ncbi:MAG: hypothetical protein ACREGL_02775, partial [Alphaproteobacteria bacterium]
MALSRSWPLILALGLSLSACEFGDKVLWPSLSDGSKTDQEAKAADERGAGGERPSVAEGETAPTPVGQSVADLSAALSELKTTLRAHEGEIEKLRADLRKDSERYQASVDVLTKRLAVGTTPGNPALTDQLNQTYEELDRWNDDVARANQLSSEVSESSASAYSLVGATEEQYRRMGQLVNEVNETVVSIDRLLNALNEEVGRHSNAVGRERSTLATLSTALESGKLAAGAPSAGIADVAPAAPASGSASPPPQP